MVYSPESRILVTILIFVTVHMKIYKIHVLDLSFPHRAIVSSSIASSDIQQRYLCQLWWIWMIVSADWLIIFIPKNDVSGTTVFHQAGQGHVVSRIKTCVQRMYIYPYRDGISQSRSCKKQYILILCCVWLLQTKRPYYFNFGVRIW